MAIMALTVFAKHTIVDVWQGSEYVSANTKPLLKPSLHRFFSLKFLKIRKLKQNGLQENISMAEFFFLLTWPPKGYLYLIFGKLVKSFSNNSENTKNKFMRIKLY